MECRGKSLCWGSGGTPQPYSPLCHSRAGGNPVKKLSSLCPFSVIASAARQSQPIGLMGWLCDKGSAEGNPSAGGTPPAILSPPSLYVLPPLLGSSSVFPAPSCHCEPKANQSQRGNPNRLDSWGGCVVKGVQREIPLVGVWGCPPASKKSPKIGGYRGLIESISAVSYLNC
jgi:hypothetical protein